MASQNEATLARQKAIQQALNSGKTMDQAQLAGSEAYRTTLLGIPATSARSTGTQVPAAPSAQTTAAVTRPVSSAQNSGNQSFSVNWTPVEGFQLANDTDKAAWAGIVNTYNQGGDWVGGLNKLTGAGNFSGYADPNTGAYTGMLRVGTSYGENGTYQPALNGKLGTNGWSGDITTYSWYGADGSVYKADAQGNLTRVGSYDYGNTTPYQQAIAAATGSTTPKTGAQGSTTTPKTGTQVSTATATGTQGQVPTPSGATSGTTAGLTTPVNATTAPTWTGGDFDYTGNTMYQDYLNRWQNAEAPAWEGSEYERMRDELTAQAAAPWEYSLEDDPAWQAYRKQYTREGRRSTEDTMGRYAAMTGGRPSTAAVQAAQQAGNYYNAQMTDKIPELYQQAYQRYLNEYQRLMGIAGAYGSYGQQDYNRYQDRLGQWNTDRNFAYGAAQDAISNARADYNTRYNQYLNELDRYNTDRSFAYQQQRDAISDQRYDREWAQQLREYADTQGWKAKEWEQYLAEYGDQLSEKERQWAYQMERDAVEDERYAQKWDYTMYRDAIEDELTAQDTAWSRMLDTWKMQNTDRANEMDEAEWLAGYGRYDKLAELLGMSEEEVRAKYETPQVSGYSGSYSGSENSSSSSSAGPMDILEALAAAGITDQTTAQRYIEQYFPKYKDAANLAADYMAMAGLDGGTNDADLLARMREAGVKDANEAFYWLIGEGKSYADAEKFAKYYTTGAAEAIGTQNAQYDQIVSSLNKMVVRDANWTEIQAEIDAEERDGNISHEEAQALKAAYRDKVDNVPNSGEKHKNGRPMSKGYMDVLKRVEGQRKQRYALGTSAAAANQNALTALLDAYDRGEIHEYEIEIIRETLGI